jgi:hypothetical protein
MTIIQIFAWGSLLIFIAVALACAAACGLAAFVCWLSKPAPPQ